MNKPFRNINVPKSKSSSTSFISLHFNKADEDQLEISYGDEADDKKEDNTTKEIPNPGSTSLKVKTQNLDKNELDGHEFSTNDSNSVAEKNDSDQAIQGSAGKHSSPSISKRAYSLDSDLGAVPLKNPDKSEPFTFFKDIKGKIVKSIEDRKSVTKSLNKEDKKIPFPEEAKSDENYSEQTPSARKKILQLSPAIEASERNDDKSLFDEYINDELDKAKCEILSTKTPFTRQQPKKSPSTVEKKDTIKNNEEKTTEPVHSPDEKRVTQNTFYKLPVFISKSVYFVKSYWKSVIFRILVVIFALLFAPLPSWLCGFLCGAFIAGSLVYFVFKPGQPKQPFTVPDFSKLSPAHISVTEVDVEPIIYKGWMNELPFEVNYNSENYHVNLTRSLYVRLDGSYLRVSYPQNNIAKRAMFNEPRQERQFVHQQHYDITGAFVELLPKGLTRKRLWSKKYPICLRIPNPKQAVLSNSAKENLETNPTPKNTTTNRKESPVKKMTPRINDDNEVVLYLFSRTDREKDLWYIRFKKASRLKLLKSHSPSSSPNIAALEASSNLENKRTYSLDLASLQNDSDLDSDMECEVDGFSEISMSKQQKFELYLSHLMSRVDHLPFNPKDKKEKAVSSDSRATLQWLNVLIGRVFFDFLTEEMWAQLVTERIQRKLSKIKLPVFLKELIVKDINLGTALPKIHRASEPTIDQRGLWIDIDLSYNGSFQMTLETKINLMRFKCDTDGFSVNDSSGSSEMEQMLRSPVYNSDEEDSADTSSDEDVPLPEVNEANSTDGSTVSTAGGSAGKKLLRFVDRLAQSSYFQHAAKNKYIKKAMEDISNTPLVLTVEVQWLTGTLALNIPPMPTDRLWYGFRTNPQLSIVARPKLGHKVVTFSHVTEWIEKKLVSEFQKILVMPNMDDLIVPIMQADADLL